MRFSMLSSNVARLEQLQYALRLKCVIRRLAAVHMIIGMNEVFAA